MGLLLAWGGTALLVNPAAGRVADSSSVSGGVVDQVALWLLFAAVVGIVVFWEKQPLGSLWLKPLEWQSLGWASVLTVFSIMPAGSRWWE